MSGKDREIIAVRIRNDLGVDGFPVSADWERAQPLKFAHDWQGKNADPERSTEVRVVWSDEALHVRFVCHYRSLTVFGDLESLGRRDRLWERDVAEVFLQPDRFGTRYYKEFEIAPNGCWLDLDITPAGLRHIQSGMRSAVRVHEKQGEWTATLSLPIQAITSSFDPGKSWRVNFFRCEGVDSGRFYSAWQPTHTSEPQFHVPESFGDLRFSDDSHAIT